MHGLANLQEAVGIRVISAPAACVRVCVGVFNSASPVGIIGKHEALQIPAYHSKIYLQDGKMKLSSCNLKSIQEVALLTVL